MANTVQIVITVDNAQAVAAMGATKQALQQVGVSGGVSMGQIASASQAAAPAIQQVGAAAQQMGGHVTTSLDGVRLLSQEFGLRLPRALESILARMPAVTAAVSSLIGAFAGIAIAEVFARMGTAAYNLYEKYISLNAVADAYNKKVLEHRSEQWADTKDIEMTTERLNLATEAARRYNEEAQRSHNQAFQRVQNGFMNPIEMAHGVTDLLFAHQQAENSVKNQEAADTLFTKQLDQQHELNRLKIDAAHAGDGDLGREQKITAERTKQLQLLAEDARYRSDQSFDVAAMFAMRAPRGPDQSDQLQSQMIQQKAQADALNLAREERNQRIQFQNEAVNSGLAGSALLRAQEEQAIASVTQKYKDGEISMATSRAERASIEEKFDNENTNHIQDQIDAAQKLNRTASQAGLTGAAKIVADHDNAVQDVNTDRTLDPATASLRRQAFQTEENQKLDALQSEYTDRVKAEVESRTEASLKGFARIDAEQRKSVDAANKAYQDMAGGTDVPQSFKDQAAKSRDTLTASAAQQAAAQRIELQQQVQQQTLQMTTEAAQAERRVRAGGIGGWVDDYHRGIAEIQAAESAMQHKIADEQAKTGSNPDTDAMFNQQKVAAVQKADAQIEQLNTEMAHQIAGTLQGAFDDPVHYIQRKMQSMMMEILADWLMKSKAFSSAFGGIMGGLHPVQKVAAPPTINTSGGGSTPALQPGISIPGLYSSPTGTVALPSDAVGTVQQASVARGYSGTASTEASPSGAAGTIGHAAIAPGYSGTASPWSKLSSGGFGGGMLGSSLSSAGSMVQMGMSAAHDLSTHKGSSLAASSPATSTVANAHGVGGAPGAGGGGIATIGTLAHTGISATHALSQNSGASISRSPAYADNGEDGGFAGYLTGNADDANGDPSMVSTSAGQQVQQQQAQQANGVANAQGQQNDKSATAAAKAQGMLATVGATPAAVNDPSANNAKKIGGVVAVGAASYVGTKGIIGAFESGKASGIATGAESGAAMGAAIGSVIPAAGTVVGGAVGAVGGAAAGLTGWASGEGGRIGTQKYYKTSLLPQMVAAETAYEHGDGGDALSAIANINGIAAAGVTYMASKFGSSAAAWNKAAYLDKEVTFLTTQIGRAASGGHDYASKSAAQFHTGGTISDFGDLATSSNEGFIHALMNETVMNPAASSAHGPELGMMNAGASPSDIASHYLKSTASSAPPQSSQGGDINHTWHVNTLDASSFEKFLTHGGGMTAVTRATNKFQSQYSGDGVSG